LGRGVSGASAEPGDFLERFTSTTKGRDWGRMIELARGMYSADDGQARASRQPI
jgi:hypothetical protein